MTRATREDKGTKRPRGRCFICGYEYALYRSGTVYRHFAVNMCGQIDGRHNHNDCRTRFGVTCVPQLATGKVPLCPGAGQLPSPLWLINVVPNLGRMVCHLASPNQPPHLQPTQLRLVYPDELAGRQANHPVRWRTICRPRLNQSGPHITSLGRCSDDPPLVELPQISCDDCAAWACSVRRRYLPALV